MNLKTYNPNQPVKLLILLRLFQEETDKNHWISTAEILAKLKLDMVQVDRRTLYTMMDELSGLGQYKISRRRKGNITEYALTERDFDAAELKLLAASVQSSRFLTTGKARALTNKLRGLASKYERDSIYSGMLAYGRVRSMNESIYNNLDRLNAAVEGEVKIKFKYFEWDNQAKKHYRHGGALYSVSPYLIVSQNDKIYMTGRDDRDGEVKNYRVDKMEYIRTTEEPCVYIDHLSRSNPSEYVASMFNMYGGEKAVDITLNCDNSISNVIVDTFGNDMIMVPHNEDGTFNIHIKVVPNDQFYGWMVGLHPKVKIVFPENEIIKFRSFVQSLSDTYL